MIKTCCLQKSLPGINQPLERVLRAIMYWGRACVSTRADVQAMTMGSLTDDQKKHSQGYVTSMRHTVNSRTTVESITSNIRYNPPPTLLLGKMPTMYLARELPTTATPCPSPVVAPRFPTTPPSGHRRRVYSITLSFVAVEQECRPLGPTKFSINSAQPVNTREWSAP